MTALIQHVAKSETHGIAEQAIAHGTRVDEPELHVRLRPCGRGQAEPA
jgi:hypothetical protein